MATDYACPPLEDEHIAIPQGTCRGISAQEESA